MSNHTGKMTYTSGNWYQEGISNQRKHGYGTYHDIHRKVVYQGQ